MWAVTCEAAGVGGRAWYVSEGAGIVPRTPRLLDTVRDALRVRHYSRRTERAYLGWIRRHIVFHAKRHPAETARQKFRDSSRLSPWKEG